LADVLAGFVSEDRLRILFGNVPSARPSVLSSRLDRHALVDGESGLAVGIRILHPVAFIVGEERHHAANSTIVRRSEIGSDMFRVDFGSRPDRLPIRIT